MNETNHSHMVKIATKGKTPVLTVKMTVIQKATQVHDSMQFLIFYHSRLDRTTRIRRMTKEELMLMNQRIK
jgi:hypothetical protein